MEFKKIINEFLYLKKNTRSEGTYHYYRKNFNILTKALKDLKIFNTSDLKRSSYEEIVMWIKKNTKKKNSKTNDTMACFLTLLKHNDFEHNMRLLKLLDDTSPFKIIDDKELKELINYLERLDIEYSNNLHWISCILIALDTGARKNELINIETKNVNLNNNTIFLDTTKTFKRTVNFGKLSKKYISKIYDVNEKYLLKSYSSDQMTRRSIEHFINKINKELKFDSGNVTLHRLRKTLATKFYLNGMPIISIQRVLGHSTIEMTMRYIEVNTLVMQKDYKKFYPY